MLNNFSKGSVWRKWDLHIHTPGTKKNDQYKLKNGNIWDEFCKEIEASEVQVFGITDYFSADGYFNFINKFKTKHPNSEKVFFPNIELCTSDVVNKSGEEVNLHLIFDSNHQDIESKIRKFLQILKINETGNEGVSRVASDLTLETEYNGATTTRDYIYKAISEVFGANYKKYLLIFTAVNGDGIRVSPLANDGVETRGLNRKIIISDELDKFSDGFFGNSGNKDYFLLENRLDSNKKTFPKPVICGSDAHSLHDLGSFVGKQFLNKDGQIEKDITWIKADPTFEGLKQILIEPKDRVFIGDTPTIINRIKNHKTKYLKTIEVKKIDGSELIEKWFEDVKVELNPGLVAIIGNKGNCKSALTDIVGLLGNTPNYKYFSFLSSERFRDPKDNKASHFHGKLVWESGESNEKNLDSLPEQYEQERIKYIPQNFFEVLCNEEKDSFEIELKKAIFSHIPPSGQLGANNIDELIEKRTGLFRFRILEQKNELSQINSSIAKLTTAKKPTYKQKIEEQLRIKKEELMALKKPDQKSSPKPQKFDTEELSKKIKILNQQKENLEVKIAKYSSRTVILNKNIQYLTEAYGEIENIKSTILTKGNKLKQILNQIDESTTINVNILTFNIKDSQLKIYEKKYRDELEQIDKLFDNSDPNNLLKKLEEIDGNMTKLKQKMGEPERKYQEYLLKLKDWEKLSAEIIGDREKKNTIKNLEYQLEYISKFLDVKLRQLEVERIKKLKDIFENKRQIVYVYKSVYAPVEKFIKGHDFPNAENKVNFDASLQINDFHKEFFSYIHQGIKGSFYGLEEGKKTLSEIIGKADFNSATGVIAFISTILRHLTTHTKSGIIEARHIEDQLKNKNIEEFFNYLYALDYLEPGYELKLGGRQLGELSPGEKGALLLIFYLLIDKGDIPLVLDQPEENLDNQSIFTLLVPYIKETKKNRQVIIVTHNPNLAVVCDAEQIVYASLNKKNKHTVRYEAGSIENPTINKKIMDVLEGTLPAFRNRGCKYRITTDSNIRTTI